eukprot:741508_1
MQPGYFQKLGLTVDSRSLLALVDTLIMNNLMRTRNTMNSFKTPTILAFSLVITLWSVVPQPLDRPPRFDCYDRCDNAFPWDAFGGPENKTATDLVQASRFGCRTRCKVMFPHLRVTDDNQAQVATLIDNIVTCSSVSNVNFPTAEKVDRLRECQQRDPSSVVRDKGFGIFAYRYTYEEDIQACDTFFSLCCPDDVEETRQHIARVQRCRQSFENARGGGSLLSSPESTNTLSRVRLLQNSGDPIAPDSTTLYYLDGLSIGDLNLSGDFNFAPPKPKNADFILCSWNSSSSMASCSAKCAFGFEYLRDRQTFSQKKINSANFQKISEISDYCKLPAADILSDGGNVTANVHNASTVTCPSGRAFSNGDRVRDFMCVPWNSTAGSFNLSRFESICFDPCHIVQENLVRMSIPSRPSNFSVTTNFIVTANCAENSRIMQHRTEPSYHRSQDKEPKLRCMAVSDNRRSSVLVEDESGSPLNGSICKQFCIAGLRTNSSAKLVGFNTTGQDVQLEQNVTYECPSGFLFKSSGNRTESVRCMQSRLLTRLEKCLPPAPPGVVEIIQSVMLLFVAFVVVLGSGLFVWVRFFRNVDHSYVVDSMVILSITFAFVDVFTDLAFLFLQFSTNDPYRVLTLVFLALPLSVNVALVIWIMTHIRKEHSAVLSGMEPSSYHWFALAHLFGILRVDGLLILSSNLTGAFTLPLRKMTRDVIRSLGVVGNVLEDIPQLVVTAIILNRKPTKLATAQVVTSAVQLIYTFVYQYTIGAILIFRFRDDKGLVPPPGAVSSVNP